ncbi:MAG: hypothetical protein C4K48_04700 [Candidatus Thorarchaeota archaeon]|nr:MAG: hypothetical protein C4K48_04700 [Candidatus Thorarchaeota archaeon]
MKIHNRNAFILCLVGGVLLFASGASGVIGLIDELAEALREILEFSLVLTLENIMAGLASITIISGVVVIVGGVMLTTSEVRAGRIIVNLAIAVGIIGLLMILVQSVMTGTLSMDMTMQLQQSFGWVGAILAFVARIIAEQKPLMDAK